jgi:malate synthase
MPDKYINIRTLKVSESLSNFVNDELLIDTGISSDKFWLGFEKTLNELEPINRDLINYRETLQKKIDDWHIKNKSNEFNLIEYKKFLVEIGYLKEEGPDFSIDTKNVDDEITKIAGPQLVVPIMNARYALNAANARWMSLYDSLYGTDVIEQSEDSVSERYDPLRGEMVIKYGRDFLDKYFPLKDMSWSKITTVAVKEGSFKTLKGIETYDLVDEEKFIGHRGEADNPSAIILKNKFFFIHQIICFNSF